MKSFYVCTRDILYIYIKILYVRETFYIKIYVTSYLLCFYCVLKGVSADADPHYQKLYGRVTDVCSNRRGQPSPSAMKEPRPGRNPSVIRFASPSGKYGFQK